MAKLLGLIYANPGYSALLFMVGIGTLSLLTSLIFPPRTHPERPRDWDEEMD